METINRKLRMSWSSLNLYESCPYKWKLLADKTLQEPPSHYLLNGMAAHKVIEDISHNKITSRAEIAMCYNEYFDDNIKGFRALRAKTLRALDIFWQYRDAILNKMVDAEFFFKVHYKKYDLVGRVDRLDKFDDGTYRLLDYKTGRFRIGVRDQLGLYQMALEQTKDITFSKLGAYMIGENRLIDFEPYNEDEKHAMTTRIERAVDSILNGDFAPKWNRYCPCAFYETHCPLR